MSGRRPEAARRTPPRRSAWTDPHLWVRLALAGSILVFGPAALEQFETPKAAVVRAIGLGALGVGLAWPAGLRRLARRPLDFAVAAWLAVEFLATAGSVSPRVSLLGDTAQREGLLTSLGLAGLYVAARAAVPHPDRLRRTLQWMVGAATLAAADALLQVAGLDPFRWSNTAGYGAGGAFVRPFGTLGQPNVLGATTAAALMLAAWLAPPARRRWPLGVAALLLGLATLATLSRAAWLGALAGALAGAALAWRARPGSRPGRGAAIAACALGAVAIALALSPLGAPLRGRLGELFAAGGGSGRSRVEIWKAALAGWRARPWLGHGPDTFAMVFPRFQTPDFWRFEWLALPAHAHSIYLHALATRGLAGLAVAAAVAVVAAGAARDAWRATASARPLVAALVAALVALAVAGAFGAIGIPGAALVVVALAALAGLSGGANVVAPAPPARAWAAAAVLAALALSWSAGDLAASHAAAYAEAGAALPDDPAGGAVGAARRAVALRPWDDTHERRLAETLTRAAADAPATSAALAAAEAAARRAVALAPLRAVDHQALGDALFARARAGDATAAARAESAYARCLALAPCDALSLTSLAQQELTLERWGAALPAAERAARLAPEVAVPRAMLARIRLARGEPALARGELEHALSLEWRGDEPWRRWATRTLAELRANPAAQESRSR